MEENVNLTDKVVDIVAAFVSKNAIPAAELPALITSVHASLTSLAGGDNAKPVEPQVPAVSVKKSVGSDYIICLEDGRKFKSLKRKRSFHCTLTRLLAIAGLQSLASFCLVRAWPLFGS